VVQDGTGNIRFWSQTHFTSNQHVVHLMSKCYKLNEPKESDGLQLTDTKYPYVEIGKKTT
jgi:hypothetical protein